MGGRVQSLEGLEAVLIDMDGTLVDSDRAVERAWVAWAGEYGVDPLAALAVAHGRPAEQTVRDLLPGAGTQVVRAAAARQLTLQYDDLEDVVASTGSVEFLALLSRVMMPWAVVTSADQRLAKARLRAAGLMSSVLVTSDDVTAGKPDPEGYRLAATRLCVDPSRCLVVEDSLLGVRAGKAAGARVAALKGLPADIEIADLGQLVEVLAVALAGGD